MIYKDAKPNDAHIVLAKLEQQGKLKAVITQNIDGLHQKAGSSNVIEVHGTLYKPYIVKSLNDPEKLYEIAWFSRYGKESIDALKNVYESEINRLREEISKKEKVTKVTENKEVKTINDLFKID